MLRPATANDESGILALSQSIGLFDDDDFADLEAMLNSHFASGNESRDLWLVDEDSGIAGVALLSPERMTDRTWNLLFIAVDPKQQRGGRGSKLLEHIEQTLVQREARLLLVETLGIEEFAGVREFYLRNGFTREATIRDFYFAGGDKVVFWKSFGNTATTSSASSRSS